VELVRRVSLEAIPAAVLVLDGLGRVSDCNQRASLFFERHGQLLRGMHVVDVLGRDVLWSAADGAAQTMPVVVPLPSGRTVAAAASVASFVDVDDVPQTMVVVVSTASQSGERSNGAPRVLSWKEVAERASELEGEALCVAVGVVGLDSVNEGFSRTAGDVVLAEIGRRLRAVSPDDAVVARISGNRFVVVGVVEAGIRAMIASIVTAVRDPIETPLGVAAVGCAAGVTTGPARPLLLLLDRANRNLDIAASRGAGTIEWNDTTPRAITAPAARLGAPLLASVAEGGISAQFQPVVEIDTGRIIECEALARWEDDTTGRHSAAQFIAVAKDTGAVVELGVAVLRRALRLCQQLMSIDRHSTRVSVNVTALELSSPAFVPRTMLMLDDAGVPPTMLQFELTDDLFLDDRNLAANVTELREHGIRFALDSFGARSANLLAMRDVVIDCIKVDAALTHRVTRGSRALALFSATLAFAADLGADVVAKGIETIEQHLLLTRAGCRYAQGHLYHPPQAPEDLTETLRHPPTLSPRVVTATRQADVTNAVLESGALEAAHFQDLLRTAATVTNADMAAFAVINTQSRWIAWEINAACTSGRPDLDQLVSAIYADGAKRIGNTLAGVPVVTSDGTTLGALCVYSPDDAIAVGIDSSTLTAAADDVAARIRQHLN
jgi:EAL domain-containing protein (putative c-di-GMP-specific phosphodiesterase class I)/GGDEF domain-containing protein